jgi:hypothetical protein
MPRTLAALLATAVAGALIPAASSASSPDTVEWGAEVHRGTFKPAVL